MILKKIIIEQSNLSGYKSEDNPVTFQIETDLSNKKNGSKMWGLPK